MLPAVVVDHQSSVVERFRKVIKRPQMSLLASVSYVGNSPAFIYWNPDDDAGMIVITIYDFYPFAGHSRHGIVVEEIGVGHLRGNQQSEFVCPIKIPRILHLLVFEK